MDRSEQKKRPITDESNNMHSSTDLMWLESKRSKLQGIMQHHPHAEIDKCSAKIDIQSGAELATRSPLIALDTHLLKHIVTFLDGCDLCGLDGCNKWLKSFGTEIWTERSASLCLDPDMLKDGVPTKWTVLLHKYASKAAEKYDVLAQSHYWEQRRKGKHHNCIYSFIRISKLSSMDGSVWQGFVELSVPPGRRNQFTDIHFLSYPWEQNQMNWEAMHDLLRKIQLNRKGPIEDHINAVANSLKVTIIFVPKISLNLVPRIEPDVIVISFHYESHQMGYSIDTLKSVRRRVLTIKFKAEAILSDANQSNIPATGYVMDMQISLDNDKYLEFLGFRVIIPPKVEVIKTFPSRTV